MTGAVLCEPSPEPAHVRVRIELGPRAGGGRGLTRIVDGGDDRARAGGARASPRPASATPGGDRPRRFGTGSCCSAARRWRLSSIGGSGWSRWTEGFTAEHLRALARGRTAPIKAFLLDQRRVAGVGNIYADEALLRRRASTRCARRGGSRCAQHARLRDAVVAVLLDGIDARGATIDDFRHVDGVRGSFQDRFLVHRRAGEPCPRAGGRSSSWSSPAAGPMSARPASRGPGPGRERRVARRSPPAWGRAHRRLPGARRRFGSPTRREQLVRLAQAASSSSRRPSRPPWVSGKPPISSPSTSHLGEGHHAGAPRQLHRALGVPGEVDLGELQAAGAPAGP